METVRGRGLFVVGLDVPAEPMQRIHELSLCAVYRDITPDPPDGS